MQEIIDNLIERQAKTSVSDSPDCISRQECGRYSNTHLNNTVPSTIVTSSTHVCHLDAIIHVKGEVIVQVILKVRDS